MTAPPAITTGAAAATLISGYAWSGTTVTYSIPSTFSTWSAYGGTGEPYSVDYRTLAPNEAPRFREAMAVWDALVAITFTETSDIGSRNGQIRIAATGTPDWGFAYLPGDHGMDGDIWIARDVLDSTSFAPGTYDWQGLLHEIGHAIGLKHPFEDPPILDAALDNYRYSIMSYTPPEELVVAFSTSGGGGLSWSLKYPVLTTPGLFDILAIQQIYGADPDTRVGATTYRFDAADASIQVIYDAGGIDTFDLANQTRRSEIDLREGAFSSVNIFDAAARIEAEVARFGETYRDTIASVINAPGTYAWHDNVGIAFGTVIENARLGRGNDSAIGNDAGNMLLGGAGDDTLDGGGGADTLDGGTGNDLMIGGAGNDRYVVYGTADIVLEVADGGTDTLVTWKRIHVLEAEVEVLRAAAAAPVSLLGNALANTVIGTAFADTINGGEGDDALYGLADADRILGSGGRDTLIGDTGRDSLFGGAGDDRLWGQGDDDRLQGDAGNDTALGGDGADTLFGLDGNDALYGDAGDDSVLGGTGGDSLFGGAGNDTLIGQGGADTLHGGPGADIFRFVIPAEGGDVIRDFNRALGDVISVGTNAFRHGADAGLTPGVNFIAMANPVAPSAEVAFLYDTTTGALRYDADGTGGIAPVLLATLLGAPTLTAADIVYA
ncbi:M10 family metallopeptidase [Roseomonas sp. CAU 1739]|uniref:M10 family metallopeptidase n=1 Tax=Roseomonas sp. CAU 1739 TaxID=3140364 RepID=UPI00325C13A7